MIYWFIGILIVVIILFTPLRIRILRNDMKNDVDLYIVRIFNLRVDIDELIKVFAPPHKSNIGIVNSVSDIINIYHNKNFITTLLKMSQVKKLTIILKNSIENEEIQMLFNTIGWLAIAYFRDRFHKSFKHIENEYYMVDNNSKKPIALNLEIVFQVRIIFFIISLITNIKEIPKIFKLFKKGSEKS